MNGLVLGPTFESNMIHTPLGPFSNLFEDLQSQLRQEDKYNATIDGFKYTVKDYDGKWLVFRRDISMDTARTTQAQRYMVHEIKIMLLRPL